MTCSLWPVIVTVTAWEARPYEDLAKTIIMEKEIAVSLAVTVIAQEAGPCKEPSWATMIEEMDVCLVVM